MRRGLVGLVAVAMLGVSPAAVRGQDGEYTAPGELGVDPGVASENLAKAVDESIWTLGPVRIDPSVTLREVSYVQPLEGDGDVTASASAGIRAFLPIGPRLTFSAQIQPTYIWWMDRDESRRLGGTYGVGVFYYSGWTQVRATASSSDLDDFITDEADRRGEVDAISYRVQINVPIGGRLGAFAAATRVDQTVEEISPVQGSDLSDLSYVTDRIEGGLTWRFAPRFTLRVGAGINETEFAESARNRSNEGEYRLAGIDWRRSRLNAEVTYRMNDQQAISGSEFGEFEGATWSARLTWRVRERLSLSAYGARQLSYSIEDDLNYYVNERVGLRADLPIGERITSGVFYEVGTRTYEPEGRREDVSSVGGQLVVRLTRRLRLSAVGRTTRNESEFETQTIDEVRFGVSLGFDRRGFF